MFCLVPSGNEESIKLFANNGFAQSGKLKDWLVKGESYSDVLVLQKFF